MRQISPLLKFKHIIYFIFLGVLLYSCDHVQNDTSSANKSSHFSIGERFSIHSKILEEEREIWVHVPEGFYGMNETNTQFPVAYVLDGENLFLPTTSTTEQLSAPFSANDLAPQMIIVGVPNVNRNRDFTPSNTMLMRDPSTLEVTGGADVFTEFIEKELIPVIEEKYPTAAHRTLIGHSLGGLFVMNTLMNAPQLFNNYLAIDPALNWEEGKFLQELIHHIKNTVFDNKRLFVATANNKYPWMNFDNVKQDTSLFNQMMRSLLLFDDELTGEDIEGLNISRKYYPNETHFQIVTPALYDGLRWFFDGFSFSEIGHYYSEDNPKKDEELLPDFIAHYKDLSYELGYEVIPSESYVNAWAFGFLRLGKTNIAKDLLDLNMKNYPKSAHVHSAKGEYELVLQDTTAALEKLNYAFSLSNDDYLSNRIKSLTNE